MNKLDRVLDKFPKSENEHRRKIAKDFGISEIQDLKDSYLFGAAELGKKLALIFKSLGIELKGICDNRHDLWGSKISGLTVYSPQSLTSQDKVIIASKYVLEIHDQLRELKVNQIIPHYILTYLYPDKFSNVIHQNAISSLLKSKTKIEKVYGLLSDEESRSIFLSKLKFWIDPSPVNLPILSGGEEYFPSMWKFSKDEIFADVGAYDGDTLKKFLRVTKGIFKHYIALEPDKKNFDDLKKMIPTKYKNKITPICAGAGAEDGVASFSNSGREDSMISQDGSKKIKIIRLDDAWKEPFTTVKIDVEGYEPEVIKGMKEALGQNPKLAICVYHRPDHLWTLPLMILAANNKYRFMYLRHYETELYGTVLYVSVDK